MFIRQMLWRIAQDKETTDKKASLGLAQVSLTLAVETDQIATSGKVIHPVESAGTRK